MMTSQFGIERDRVKKNLVQISATSKFKPNYKFKMPCDQNQLIEALRF